MTRSSRVPLDWLAAVRKDVQALADDFAGSDSTELSRNAHLWTPSLS